MSDTELHISALQTETGVNMGDHAQDVTKALVLDPAMTIRELCEKALTKSTWVGVGEPHLVEPDPGKFVVIRLAVTA